MNRSFASFVSRFHNATVTTEIESDHKVDFCYFSFRKVCLSASGFDPCCWWYTLIYYNEKFINPDWTKGWKKGRKSWELLCRHLILIWSNFCLTEKIIVWGAFGKKFEVDSYHSFFTTKFQKWWKIDFSSKLFWWSLVISFCEQHVLNNLR